MQSYKSAEVAGVLGIVLGSVGAQDFYLENYRKMAAHVGLLVVSFGLIVLDMLVLPLSLACAEGWAECAQATSALGSLTLLVMLGNFFWGVVEGILILLRGDNGLARRGYRISNSRLQAKNTRSVAVEEEKATSSTGGLESIW